jgi:hypothetical protein
MSCFGWQIFGNDLHDIVDLPLGFRSYPGLFANAGKMALRKLPCSPLKLKENRRSLKAQLLYALVLAAE